MIPYFENDAYPPAVVGFQFWIEFWYCETLVKMVYELLKSSKNKGTALFLSTQCYVHKIQRCPFIFGDDFSVRFRISTPNPVGRMTLRAVSFFFWTSDL